MISDPFSCHAIWIISETKHATGWVNWHMKLIFRVMIILKERHEMPLNNDLNNQSTNNLYCSLPLWGLWYTYSPYSYSHFGTILWNFLDKICICSPWLWEKCLWICNIFCWEPEGHYHHRTVIAPFWFDSVLLALNLWCALYFCMQNINNSEIILNKMSPLQPFNFFIFFLWVMYLSM